MVHYLCLQLHCPFPSDQLSLLRLLSSSANQLFSYYPSSQSELSFVGANGETLEADSEHINVDKVSRAEGVKILCMLCKDWFFLIKHLTNHYFSFFARVRSLQLSSSRTDFTLSGEPEWFPLDDFVAQEDDFGFSLGRACFCDTITAVWSTNYVPSKTI